MDAENNIAGLDEPALRLENNSAEGNESMKAFLQEPDSRERNLLLTESEGSCGCELVEESDSKVSVVVSDKEKGGKDELLGEKERSTEVVYETTENVDEDILEFDDAKLTPSELAAAMDRNVRILFEEEVRSVSPVIGGGNADGVVVAEEIVDSYERALLAEEIGVDADKPHQGFLQDLGSAERNLLLTSKDEDEGCGGE